MNKKLYIGNRNYIVDVLLVEGNDLMSVKAVKLQFKKYFLKLDFEGKGEGRGKEREASPLIH